jgi:hypothetical protein
VSRRLFVAAASLAALLLFVGPALTRPETTNPAATIPIKVTITERAITMRPNAAVRGVAAEFIVTNRGKKAHTVRLRDVGTGKRPGFTTTLRPDQQKIFVMFLDYRGLIHCVSLDAPTLTATLKVT